MSDIQVKENEIIEMWNQFRGEHDFHASRFAPNSCHANMFDLFETEVLYSLVRTEKPESIIEFSPASGWTSFVMLEACKQNAKEDPNYKAIIKSFDLVDHSRRCDYDDDRVKRELYVGDALQLVPLFIEGCEFLFIDSDHSAEFAKSYFETIIKKYDCGFIWIHDWEGYEALVHHEGKIIQMYEPEAVKNCIQESNLSIYPVINLMDYFLNEMDSDTRNYLHSRRLNPTSSEIGIPMRMRGDRSPSQILYKEK
jgi:hypothetical protein